MWRAYLGTANVDDEPPPSRQRRRPLQIPLPLLQKAAQLALHRTAASRNTFDLARGMEQAATITRQVYARTTPPECSAIIFYLMFFCLFFSKFEDPRPGSGNVRKSRKIGGRFFEFEWFSVPATCMSMGRGACIQTGVHRYVLFYFTRHAKFPSVLNYTQPTHTHVLHHTVALQDVSLAERRDAYPLPCETRDACRGGVVALPHPQTFTAHHSMMHVPHHATPHTHTHIHTRLGDLSARRHHVGALGVEAARVTDQARTATSVSGRSPSTT